MSPDPLSSLLETLVNILIQIIQAQFADFIVLFEILVDLGIIMPL